MTLPCLGDLREAIRSVEVRSVLDHWTGLATTGLAPSFDDIDPFAIKRALPFLWILRYDRATDSFAYRIAGEEVNFFFRKNMSGKSVQGSMHASLAQAFEGRARRACQDWHALHFVGQVYSSDEYAAAGERLFLPLAPARNDDGGILGVTHARGHDISTRALDDASGDLNVIRDGAYRVYDARVPVAGVAAAQPAHGTPIRP